MINGFSFGRITIDGRQYDSDLMIFPDGRVVDGWWRTIGHRLTLADITPMVATAPQLIVAGTGINGRMRPESDLASALKRQGIELMVAANADAIRFYNANYRDRRVGACFHLTC